MDVFLAFPLIVFAIALVGVIPDTRVLRAVTGNGLRIGVLVFVIGFFNWPYVGRIVRGQALSLREREFVEGGPQPRRHAGSTSSSRRDAAQPGRARSWCYATLLIPVNILFEAALSVLGVGVAPPTATWGGMLSDASHGLYQIAPNYMIFPGLAIFLTVLAFNLFGDGLRDAIDPQGRR